MKKAFVFDAYGTLYDLGSVEQSVEAVFPGQGSLIAHVWRMKQLEYSWLTTLMNRYEDFWSMTLRSLDYTLWSLQLAASEQLRLDIAATYLDLAPYDDAVVCLGSLVPHRRAILSNGTRSMLSALAANSRLDRYLDHILSVDAVRAFKPAPQAYEIVEQALSIERSDVVFVSSNGFDICGAKSFGFTVVRVARADTSVPVPRVAPNSIDERLLYGLIRDNAEMLDHTADFTVPSLADIPRLFCDHGNNG
jgi:2-haloacid dehalogenase